MTMDTPAGQGPKRVVIFDDDPVCRALHRAVVEECVPGVVVVEADEGIRGMAAVMKHTPDLVLADLALPNIDGRRVVRELKAMPKVCHIPILVISSVRLGAIDVHPMQQGVFHVTKPVARDDLKSMIMQCLSVKRVVPGFEPSILRGEFYCVFDQQAMAFALGTDWRCQLEVLGLFVALADERLRVLDQVRLMRLPHFESRTEVHGMLGSARVVGANRLSYRLWGLRGRLEEDDLMLIELYALEAKDALEAAVSAVRGHMDSISREASVEILDRIRARQDDPGKRIGEG